MIDSHLKPWLIEVNGSPSMTANVGRDGAMKRGMLDDVFTILNLERMYNVFLCSITGDELQIGGFDLVYKDGKRMPANLMDFNNGFNSHVKNKQEYSMIGTLNNR